MSPTLRKALEYVRNTNGGANKAQFLEDHEPIGPGLWRGICTAGLVRVGEAGRIHLTEAGAAALAKDPTP